MHIHRNINIISWEFYPMIHRLYPVFWEDDGYIALTRHCSKHLHNETPSQWNAVAVKRHRSETPSQWNAVAVKRCRSETPSQWNAVAVKRRRSETPSQWNAVGATAGLGAPRRTASQHWRPALIWNNMIHAAWHREPHKIPCCNRIPSYYKIPCRYQIPNLIIIIIIYLKTELSRYLPVT